MNKNKKHKLYIIFCFVCSLLVNIAYAADTRLDYDNLCTDDGINSTMKLIGYLIMIIKIVVPLIIIALGSFDFAKSVISNDDNAINKATSSLIKRFIAGILIFLIPYIILGFMDVLSPAFGEYENSNLYACVKCVLDTSECN